VGTNVGEHQRGEREGDQGGAGTKRSGVILPRVKDDVLHACRSRLITRNTAQHSITLAVALEATLCGIPTADTVDLHSTGRTFMDFQTCMWCVTEQLKESSA
jgi:hypothetical protein